MRNNIKNTTITSRFNFLYLFLLFFFIVILFFLYVLIISKEEIILFLIAFMAFVLYGIYMIVKSLIFYRVDSKNIKIGIFKTYTYNEVKSIELHSSVPSKFMFFTIYEKGLTIHLKNNKKIYLKEAYYTNFWKLRLHLDNTFGNKQIKISKPVTNSTIAITNKTTSIPFYITLVKIIILIALTSSIILLLDLFITNYLDPGYFIFSTGTFLFLLLFTTQMGYIESSKNYIIIKNLINPFVKKIIPTNDITHTTKETVGGGRNKRTFITIHTVYHKKFKVTIDFISQKREKNIVKQFKKLAIPYKDYT
ncbi:hypothetical protein KLA_01575 [Cellulophaga geojensis KL-A]|nr:hypothetical protein KLA_01575 [Cellulophaga geojensis KL-A]